MSDTASPTAAAAGSAPQFTERELQILGWAMQSLKSGVPEIDYEKLAAFAGMSNSRSASNAWLKLKKKLMPDGEASPATPKKASTPAKKKAAKVDSEDGETPKKATPRKRAPKKQEAEGGDASPKKRGRPAKNKKDAEPVDVKAESDDAEADGDDFVVKPEAVDEDEDLAV